MGGNTRRMSLVVALAGSLTLVASSLLYGASTEADPFAAFGVTHLTPGAPETPFDLKALDGATLGSQELAGKIVVLNFWATWCGPCKEEMPSLARLQSQFDPEQVRIVTVTTDLYPQGIKQFLDHLGLDLPVLFDEDQEVSRLFTVRGLPTTVVIGRDGHAIGRAVGPRSWDSRESIALVREVLHPQP